MSKVSIKPLWTAKDKTKVKLWAALSALMIKSFTTDTPAI